MSYNNSNSCQQQLSDIEAIDFFFAQKMLQLFKQNDELLFHIMLALQYSLRQGHSCLPLAELSSQTYWQDLNQEQAGYKFPKLEQLQTAIKELAINPDDNAPIVLQNERLYLRRYWQFEQEVATNLKQRTQLKQLNTEQMQIAKSVFSQLFPDNNPSNDPDWQKVAVANSLGRKLTIISGGPGTGKTYTVTRLLAALQAVHLSQLKIQMAAPTGKAAQRLKESITNARAQLLKQGIEPKVINAIPEQASTLHRLLGYRPNSTQLKYNADNKLNCNLLLIDEVSMIDLPMMARVLRALADDAILILLGDAEQLPSVEVGSLLADISQLPHPGFNSSAATQIKQISGELVPIFEPSHYNHLTLLTKSHRFGGAIGEIAKEVITANKKQSWQRLLKAKQTQIDFAHSHEQQLSYLPEAMLENWLETAVTNYFAAISKADDLQLAFKALAKFRILVPTRVGERGVESLNPKIEQLLSFNNRQVIPGQHYQGRPIMVSENSYAMNLFNGDIGLIWPDDSGKLMAWFEQSDGNYRCINPVRLPKIETVYAMTIHKTQGSEFAHVAMILPEQPSPILSPELLYTGLTRAKQHLYIIGSETVWRSALSKKIRRYSGLKL